MMLSWVAQHMHMAGLLPVDPSRISMFPLIKVINYCLFQCRCNNG